MNRHAMATAAAAILLSVAGSVVQGGQAESKAYGALTIWPDSVNWLDGGYGHVLASVMYSPPVERAAGGRDAWAVATGTVPTAVAEGDTGSYAATDWSRTLASIYNASYIDARALAKPIAPTAVHGAQGVADLWYEIAATEAGTLTFGMNWETHQSRSASSPGESAWTEASFAIGLVGGDYDADTHTWEWEVVDRLIQENVNFTFGTVSVQRQFAEGETALLWIAVDARAQACNVPAPAAVVLGLLGAGTLGLLRRRIL